MGNSIKSGQEMITNEFRNGVDRAMLEYGKTLEGVIKEFPSILIAKDTARNLISDCIEQKISCKVSYFNKYEPTCRFRDPRIKVVYELTDIVEVIVCNGKVYKNIGETDGVSFKNDNYVETRLIKNGSSWWLD